MRLRIRHALIGPTIAVALLGTAQVDTPPGLATVSATPPPPFTVRPGQTFERLAWVLPVTGYRLTGRFGDSASVWSSRHTGLDFATEQGSTIRAVTGGVVTATAYDGAYGNKTVVTLADGTEVWYCHQDTQRVTRGERVVAGQPIGTVGSTGNVTGPHLHLEVRPRGGEPVDPWQVLAEHGRRV